MGDKDQRSGTRNWSGDGASGLSGLAALCPDSTGAARRAKGRDESEAR